MKNLEKSEDEFLVLSKENVINKKEEFETGSGILLKAAKDGLVLKEYIINEIIRLRMLLGSDLEYLDDQVGDYLTASPYDLLDSHKNCIEALLEKLKNQINDAGMKK